MPPKVDNGSHCGGCKKPLKPDSVQCNVCTLWYDMKCSGCDSDTATFLRSAAGKSSSVHWHCTSCDSSTRALHDMISTINTRVNNVESKIDDLKEGFESMEEKVGRIDHGLGEVATSLRNDIRQVAETLNVKIDSLVASSKHKDRLSSDETVSNAGIQENNTKTAAAGIISQVANELREREKRVLNVVFNGNVDKVKVDRFLQAAGTEKPSKVLEIQTQQKKTLYIVTMSSEKDKWSLIAKARTISQSKEGLDNIFVNPDLTKTERDVQYQLRQEVRSRREQGESVKISKGKVVVVQKS